VRHLVESRSGRFACPVTNSRLTAVRSGYQIPPSPICLLSAVLYFISEEHTENCHTTLFEMSNPGSMKKSNDFSGIENGGERINPFSEIGTPGSSSPPDEELVSKAQAGDKDALERLVRRHQPWVFNIAIRMIWHREAAEDATQEILIKVVTKLSTFRGQSQFRTWLYRIAVNHLLNVRKSEFEEQSITFTDMGRALDETPDLDLPDPKSVPVDLPLLVEEARVSCMTGMLICLDRRQRLAFILGEYFGVTSEVGGEVMEVSPDNFRQLLSRARRDLYQFMNEKCGLVNTANPCRCAKKTRSYIQEGYVDPERLQFTKSRLASVSDVAPNRLNELANLDRKHAELFRDHGFLAPPDLATRLRALISQSGLATEIGSAR
jgi:RNA polymerase sigma factor (sigma-70 family)